jgi:hypothetical protein
MSWPRAPELPSLKVGVAATGQADAGGDSLLGDDDTGSHDPDLQDITAELQCSA